MGAIKERKQHFVEQEGAIDSNEKFELFLSKEAKGYVFSVFELLNGRL